MSAETFTCVLCTKSIQGQYGNNPYPLSNTGKCCDSCNLKVIMARMNFN